MWEDLYIENAKQALREAEHVHIALMRNALRNPLNHEAINSALTNARAIAKGRIHADFFGVETRYSTCINFLT